MKKTLEYLELILTAAGVLVVIVAFALFRNVAPWKAAAISALAVGVLHGTIFFIVRPLRSFGSEADFRWQGPDLLSAAPYVLAVVLMLGASFFSDKTERRKMLVWPFLLAAGVALLGSFLFVERSFAVAFAFLVIGGVCMYAPYGPYFAIVPERLPRNVTAEVLAMINSCGALGGFVGTYFVGWLQALTGNSRRGCWMRIWTGGRAVSDGVR